jgi:hypothetical protein
MNGIYHFEAQVKLVFGVAASELVSISIIKVKNGIETILVLKSQQEAVVGAANNATSADLNPSPIHLRQHLLHRRCHHSFNRWPNLETHIQQLRFEQQNVDGFFKGYSRISQ